MNRTLVKFEGVVLIDNLEQFYFIDKMFGHYYGNDWIRRSVRDEFKCASIYNNGIGDKRCINFFINIVTYPVKKFRTPDFGTSHIGFYTRRNIPIISFDEFLKIQGFVPLIGNKYYILVPDNKKIVKIKRLQYDTENVDLFRFCNFFPIENDAISEYSDMLIRMKDLNINQWKCQKEKK